MARAAGEWVVRDGNKYRALYIICYSINGERNEPGNRIWKDP